MDLGVIGRERQRDAIAEAIEAVLAGDRVTVELIGSAGSGKQAFLDHISQLATSSGLEVARATATRTSQTTPGDVATQLELGDEAAPVLLVDNAHLSDPTSVGLLQRALAAASDGGQLLVVAHEPVAGHRALPLQRLADTARRRGELIELTLEPLTAAGVSYLLPESPEAAERVIGLTGGLHGDVERLVSDWVAVGVLARAGQHFLVAGPIPEAWEGGSALVARIDGLDRVERKLVDATALAGRPVPLDAAAALLDIPPDDVLELGERLTNEGVLTQTREGFEPPDTLSAERLEAALGDVRRAQTYRELAGGFGAAGYGDRYPGLVGGYLAEAGSWQDALPLLSGAALDAVERGALGEAFPLLDAALEAYEQSGAADPELEGRLFLGRARYYRLAGWSDLAAADLELATKRLDGPERIDALTFLAAVEDDRQDAQASDGLTAAAEYEAIRMGETAKLGSVLGLRARALTRLGFANEADVAAGKAKLILDAEGNPYQRYMRRYNAARIASDRGRAREAEVGFAGLVSDADEIEGIAGLAEKQVWWARALFMVGRPDEGLSSVHASLQNADRSGTTGSVFLSHMVRSEGAYRYGQYDEALAAADAMLGLVLQQLPAWENAARFTRGRALLALGRIEEAVEEADRAFELCPPGINGWRWRLRIRVLQMQILAARGDDWPQREAEDLTDELLQGNWLDMAVELMALRAGKESDPELARQAAALALEIGIPTEAAAAIQTGELWEDSSAAVVGSAVRGISAHMPPEWRDQWEERPEIVSALAAEEATDEAVDAASAELREELDAALVAAGLADATTTLSPAQRRERGLVRRRPVRRALRSVLIGAAVVVLGGLGALLVLNLSGVLEDQPDTTQALVTVTVPVPVTAEPGPPTTLAAMATPCPDRGGDRITVGSQSGVQKANCVHWTFPTGGEIYSSPAAFGATVVVGSRDHNAYSLDLTTGTPSWTLDTRDEVDSAPVVADVDYGGDLGTEATVFVASNDGCVYARQLLSETAPRNCLVQTGGRIVGSAAVEGRNVYFSSDDGQVYASDVEGGGALWQYPEDDPFDSGALSPPAVHGGTVFVGVGSDLHRIDAETGEGEACFSAGGPISAKPVVRQGRIYAASEDGIIWVLREDTCSAASTPPFAIGLPVVYSPAITEGAIFVTSGRRMIAIDLETNTDRWIFPADGPISASPRVAGGVVYFGSDDGNVYAIDAVTGSKLWSFPTDGLVRSTPVVADGAVYVGTTSNTFFAIGDA